MTADLQQAKPSSADPAARYFRAMVRIRRFEDAAAHLFLQNEAEGTTHLYHGQEAVAVGVCDALRAGDSVAATYRGHGALLAMGSPMESLFAELLGRETGICAGRAGSMNIADIKNGVLGCFGIVGGSIATATGAALAGQLMKDESVSVAFFGDGATNQAYFHECLNFAGIRSLPVVYVCENNLYGEWTPMTTVTAGKKIARRADAYGISGVEVDGNDVFAVSDAASSAVATARSGGGPTLLECYTYRHKGHSRVDPGGYRPREEVEAWLARDPLLRVQEMIGADVAGELQREVDLEVEVALEQAREAPSVDVGRLAFSTKEPSRMFSRMLGGECSDELSAKTGGV